MQRRGGGGSFGVGGGGGGGGGERGYGGGAPKGMAKKRSAAASAAPPPPTQTPAPTPTQTQTQTQTQTPPSSEASGASAGIEDLTTLPQLLDSRFELLDEDSALRPTIIKAEGTWVKKSRAGLISDEKTSRLNADEKKAERSRAFDLLDALSRSGELPID